MKSDYGVPDPTGNGAPALAWKAAAPMAGPRPAPRVSSAIASGAGIHCRVHLDASPANEWGELTQLPDVPAIVLQGHARADFERLTPGQPVALVMEDGTYRAFRVKSHFVFERTGDPLAPLGIRAFAPFKHLATGLEFEPLDLWHSMFGDPGQLIFYTCQGAHSERRLFVVCEPAKG